MTLPLVDPLLDNKIRILILIPKTYIIRDSICNRPIKSCPEII